TAGSLKMQVRVKLPISGVPEELSNTLTNNAISLQQLGKRWATSVDVFPMPTPVQEISETRLTGTDE
ncbi:MAG TPA: hypothetical protein VF740_04690, partial [Candidatus Acidoferrum sp.]